VDVLAADLVRASQPGLSSSATEDCRPARARPKAANLRCGGLTMSRLFEMDTDGNGSYMNDHAYSIGD
jgi:hypothetical protein